MKNKKLKAALYYLSLGFSVIPTSQDKKPLIDWKRYQEELPTEAQIRRWWSKWPDANIGLVCGKISGIDVLDIDSEEGLNMVIAEYLPESDLDKIPLVETPNGYHLYFKHRPGLRNGVRVLPGCDLRTNGGYVVAPPSKNIEGKIYAWSEDLKITEIEMITMPDKLYNALRHPQNESKGPTKRKKITLDPVEKGQRNDTLARLVGKWINEKVSLENIMLMALGWNAKLPEPLGEKEVRNTANSIFRTHQRNNPKNASGKNAENLPFPLSSEQEKNWILRLRYWELWYSGQQIQKAHDLLSKITSKGVNLSSEMIDEFRVLKSRLGIVISGTDEEKLKLLSEVTGNEP